MLLRWDMHLLVPVLFNSDTSLWKFQLGRVLSTFLGLQLTKIKNLPGNFGNILVFDGTSMGKI